MSTGHIVPGIVFIIFFSFFVFRLSCRLLLLEEPKHAG